MVGIGLEDPRLRICGLPWFSETAPRLWRFPERLKEELPEGLFEAGKQTAGVRIRFRTDSGSLSVVAEYPPLTSCEHPNMTHYTFRGISAYVDGRCWSVALPDPEVGRTTLRFFWGVPRRMREVCLYLPLYGPVEVLEVLVEEGSRFEPPSEFSVPKPVVFYGTSITQGGCASRPGLSYQAVLGRMLNVDYVNMGFSGRGRCEPEVAEVLSEIDASCFVVDVGQNNTVEELRERFGRFVAILRERRPDVPVLATTPIFYNTELWSSEYRRQAEEKRTIVRSAVEERRRSGDRMVYVLEAEDYLWSDFTDGSVDGGHPNDLGFTRMAEGMVRRLREILGLPVHKLQR